MALTPLAVALAVLAVKFLAQLVVLQRAVHMVVAVVGRVQAVQEAETITTEMAQEVLFELSGPEHRAHSHQPIQGIYK
jgi:hypothetical protein